MTLTSCTFSSGGAVGASLAFKFVQAAVSASKPTMVRVLRLLRLKLSALCGLMGNACVVRTGAASAHWASRLVWGGFEVAGCPDEARNSIDACESMLLM